MAILSLKVPERETEDYKVLVKALTITADMRQELINRYYPVWNAIRDSTTRFHELKGTDKDGSFHIIRFGLENEPRIREIDARLIARPNEKGVVRLVGTRIVYNNTTKIKSIEVKLSDEPLSRGGSVYVDVEMADGSVRKNAFNALNIPKEIIEANLLYLISDNIVQTPKGLPKIRM